MRHRPLKSAKGWKKAEKASGGEGTSPPEAITKIRIGDLLYIDTFYRDCPVIFRPGHLSRIGLRHGFGRIGGAIGPALYSGGSLRVSGRIKLVSLSVRFDREGRRGCRRVA
jgi:hypothetical protein